MRWRAPGFEVGTADVNAPGLAQKGPGGAGADLVGCALEVGGQVADLPAAGLAQQLLGIGGAEVDVQAHRQLHQLVVLAGAMAERRNLEQRLAQGLGRPRGQISWQPVVLGQALQLR